MPSPSGCFPTHGKITSRSRQIGRKRSCQISRGLRRKRLRLPQRVPIGSESLDIKFAALGIHRSDHRAGMSSIEEGLGKFAKWYKEFYNIAD